MAAVLGLLLFVGEEGLEHRDRAVSVSISPQGLKRKVLSQGHPSRVTPGEGGLSRQKAQIGTCDRAWSTLVALRAWGLELKTWD